MEDILSKLAKILAMTESSDAEEARTAAMTAVKLIKKHKIQFSLPSSPAGMPRNVNGRDYERDFREMFSVKFSRQPTYRPEPTRPTDFASASAKAGVPKYSPPPPPPTPPPPPPKPSKPKAPPVLIRSRFGGPCKSCRKRYSEGENVYWRKGDGVTHEECKSFWDDED